MTRSLAKKSAKKLLYLLKKITLDLKHFDESDAIVIFSEARGGSTWLMECLKKIPRTCVNWEPLHPENGVAPNDWGRRPYFHKDGPSSVDNILKGIISYRLNNSWTTGFTSFPEIAKSELVITKFVRANLLIPKYLQIVQFKRPPILLLRHPINVCRSQLQAFHEDESNFELPGTLNRHIYEPHLELLYSLNDPLEIKIALWCIHNCVILNDIEKYKDKLTVVEYELLARRPLEQYLYILQQLGFSDQAHSFVKKMNFEKPSSSSHIGKSASRNTTRAKNAGNLPVDKLRSIQGIFDYFEFEMYDAFSAENKWLCKQPAVNS